MNFISRVLGTALLLGSIITGQLALGESTYREQILDDFDIGVTVLTSKSDTDNEARVDGVIFLNYDGYDKAFGDNLELSIMPTNIEVNVNGENIQVYTDTATLSYYGENNFEASISALKIDFRKRNDFIVMQKEKVSLLDISATKYLELGSIEIDLNAAVSLGGVINSRLKLQDENITIKNTQYYTVDLGAGVNIPVTDGGLDLYIYGGAYNEVGDLTETKGTYFGVELNGIEVGRNKTLTPYFNYVTVDAGLTEAFSGSAKDSRAMLGIRFNF